MSWRALSSKGVGVQALVSNEGRQKPSLISIAANFTPDADDTAKALLSLLLIRRKVSPASLVETFDNGACFKTYALERNPSFSANCNVLKALLHLEEVYNYTSQISRIVTFLCNSWAEDSLRDKWVSKSLVSDWHNADFSTESFREIFLDAIGPRLCQRSRRSQ